MNGLLFEYMGVLRTRTTFPVGVVVEVSDVVDDVVTNITTTVPVMITKINKHKPLPIILRLLYQKEIETVKSFL